MSIKLKSLGCTIFLLLMLPQLVLGFTGETELRKTLTYHKDFPRGGIDFYDISPVLRDPVVFGSIIDEFAAHYADQEIDLILGIESRGFIFASALSYKLKVPLVMALKSGKLPGVLITASISKEHSHDTLAIQKGAIKPGDRVLIVDDLIATGNTAIAAQDLVTKSGAKSAELAVVIELSDLAQTHKSLHIPVFSLLKM